MKTLATNFVSKAGSMLKTTGTVVASLVKESGQGAEQAANKDNAKAQAQPAKNEDLEKMSEDEKKRIMRMIDLEDSSDEDGESDEDEQDSTGQV